MHDACTHTARNTACLCRCNSPNIIAFHDAFYAEGAVHVILEYMDCGSLADVLQRHGPLPEIMLSRISHAVLTGLAHLHRELKTVRHSQYSAIVSIAP